MYFYEDDLYYDPDIFEDRQIKISSKFYENAQEALKNILLNLYTKNPKIDERDLETSFSYLCEFLDVSDAVLDNGICVKGLKQTTKE